MMIDIPNTHRHLIEQPVCVTMVTIMPDGTPQASVVWWKIEDGYIYVSMDINTVKYRNLQRNPHVAFTAIDPNNPYLYLEIRGITEDLRNDLDPTWLDELSIFYTGKPFYGGFEPNLEPGGYLGLAKIKPLRIRCVM